MVEACLLLALAGTTRAQDGPLSFCGAEGVPVTKHQIVDLHLELDETPTLRGDRVYAPAGLPRLGDELEVRRVEVVTDVLDHVAHGFPYTFRRTYERLRVSAKVGPGPLAETFHRRSPLEGRTLAFDWDDAERDWSRRLLDEPYLTRDLWDGLRGDRQALWLLPADDDPDRGRTWEVAPEDLIARLLPEGVPLASTPKSEPRTLSWPPSGMALATVGDLTLWTGEPQGRVQARFLGLRSDGGPDVLAIGIDVALRGSLEDEKRERWPADGFTRPGWYLSSSILEWSMEGEGELLWDVAAGCMRSLQLTAEVALRHRRVLSLWRGYEYEERWSGTLDLKLGLGPLEDDC